MSSDNAVNIQQNDNEGTLTHLLTISPEVQRITKDTQDTIDKQPKQIDEQNESAAGMTSLLQRIKIDSMTLKREHSCLRYSQKPAWCSPIPKLKRVRRQISWAF